MTVTSPNNRTTYVGSGNTGPFEIGFDVSSASSFSVTRVVIATGAETTLTLNAGSNGYTVDTALEEVTLTESIDSTKRLVFLLKEPITQNDSYLANNTFPSKTVENELDKLTRIALQQQEQIDRAVSLPLGSSATGVKIPDPADGKALIWSGTQLVNSVNTFDNVIADAGASAAAAAVSQTGAASSASTATTQAGIATAKAVLTAADVVLTHADVVSTHADVVLTAADVVSSAASASTATTQAGIATTASNNSQAANSAFKYTYKTSTTMGDPSTGNIRFNNATIASVTTIAISASSADSGNPDVSDSIVTWDDSTNTNKGTLTLRKLGTPATFATFTVTGSVTDNTTWLQLSVTYVTGNGALSADDSLFAGFLRSGDKGVDGLGSGDFSTNTSTTIDSEIVLFSGTGGKTGKRSTGSGLALLTSGVLSTIAPTSAGVMIGNGSSAPTTIAPGTSGNILTSNGSAWTSTAASSGAIVKLSTQTASSSATLNFDSSIITSTYKSYIFELVNLRPATDNINMQIVVSEDNGSTIRATAGDYTYTGNGVDDSGSTTGFGDTGNTSGIQMQTVGIGNAATSALSGFIKLYNPASTGTRKQFIGEVKYVASAGTSRTATAGGDYKGTTNAINYVRFRLASGNFTSGDIICYGVL